MSEQQGDISPVNNGVRPWWIGFCRWLWNHPLRFLWFTLTINIAINIGSTWLIAPASTNAIPDTSVFGRITAWFGAHWLFSCLLLTISTALLLITWLGSRWPAFTLSPRGQMPHRDRKCVLQLLGLRYGQMLVGGTQMELDLRERATAILNANLSSRLPEQPERTILSHTSIFDVCNSAGQALLILGEPGAGKSTLLVDLAHRLVEQAESDGEQLLPILLPLSSWASHRRPLQEWLVEQAASLYNIPRQWVQVDWVLPLLDGLDEMGVVDRSACIRAINTYHLEYLRPLVVCSRTNEYEEASVHERLILHNAVVVQPLSQEQVDAYLAQHGERLASLRSDLKENATLAKLATTPLMLQLLIQTYDEQHPDKHATFQQFWTKYVQRMGKPKGNEVHDLFDRTIAWLGWLAQQMRNRNQNVFYPGKIAYWLTKRQRLWYRWSIGLLVGLVCGLLSGLIFGIVSGLFSGLSTMLLIGLSGGVFSLKSDGKEFESIQIESIEVPLEMPWSWRKELGGMLALLIALLTVVGGVALVYWIYPELTLPAEQFATQVSQTASSLPSGLVSWMHSVLPIIPSVFLSCVCSSLISLYIVPIFTLQLESQGVVRDGDRSIGYTLLGLLCSLLPWLIVLLIWYPWKTFDAHTLFAAILSLLLLTLWWLPSLLLFLLFLVRGPMPFLFHYTLRFWLWRSGFIPWNWKPVSFLEYATACSLLRREGGGYSFAHPLLLEYFADLNTVIPSSPTSVHPVQHSL